MKKLFYRNAITLLRSSRRICGKSIRSDPTGPEERFLTMKRNPMSRVFSVFWTGWKPQGGQQWSMSRNSKLKKNPKSNKNPRKLQMINQKNLS